MKPRWRLTILLAVLLCVLLTQSGRRPFAVKTAVLPDGAKLRLVDITHGRSHQPFEGSLFDRLLFSMLPRASRERQLDRWGAFETETDRTVAWISYETPPALTAPSRLTVENWTLFDEHGCEVILGPQVWPAWLANEPSGRILIPAALTPLPHHCKRLGVRFRAMQANGPPRVVAELPLWEKKVEDGAPSLSPSPLPATTQFRDLQCTLVKLLNAVDTNAGTQWPLNGPGETEVRATVQLRRGSVLAPDWEPCGIRFTDGGGEVLDPRPNVTLKREPKQATLSFFGSLWPHEPAYDVDIELRKTEFARFAPEELRTVQLPMPNLPVRVNQYSNPRTFTFGDKTVEVFDPVWWGSGPPELNIPMTIHPQSGPGPQVVLVDVVDDSGNPLRCPDSWQPNRYVHFRQPGFELTRIENLIKIRKRTRSITVTFALTEPEWVRFRVKPAQWKPPAIRQASYANRFK